MNKILNKYKSLPVQVKASTWFLVCTVLQRSITIITTPIFTRLLSTEEYGIYSTFSSWMPIITCFVSLNLYQGVYQQAIVKFRNRKEGFSASLQILTFILSAAWLLLYLFTRSFWNTLFSLNTIQMVSMFITIWMTAVYGYWSSDQRVDYKYRLLVIITLCESIIQPVLSVILLGRNENKVNGIVIGQAVAVFLVYFSLLIIQVVKGKTDIRFGDWRYALKLGIPLIPHYVSAVILNSSDRIMIQKLIGESEAGIYNLAYTISMCGTLINQAVLQTLSPWLYSKIKEEKYEDIKNVAYPAIIGIGVVNFLVILLTPELISIFAPESYGAAIWVMPPVAMSVFFMFAYNLFAAFEFYYEKTHYVSIATVCGAVLNIILNYIFINIFGYFAAGYTTLICYLIFAIAHYMFMKKICRDEINGVKVFDVKTLLLISLAFIVFSFLLMFTYLYFILRWVLIGIILVLMLVFRNKILGIYMLLRNKKEK